MAESRSLPGERNADRKINGKAGQERGLTKGNEEHSGSNRYVHYPELHVGFMCVFLCLTLSNCTFKQVACCM